jgi:hypothetical protein
VIELRVKFQEIGKVRSNLLKITYFIPECSEKVSILGKILQSMNKYVMPMYGNVMEEQFHREKMTT